MWADTTAELLDMADRIGVHRRWIQKQGTWKEHFDVSLTKRALAVHCGARETTLREYARAMQTKREAGVRNWAPAPTPQVDYSE
jgi:hypothetical protein